ncbi:MAG TPA: macrolide ABC transporter ATP-binding protein [Syntrophobacteraceae bacterium]|jgi:macrolide transport system ATP-binding/permease protein|nr:macrolide ABC transporter ATP-binding protein [Syntrophobacteraceae bacterium]
MKLIELRNIVKTYQLGEIQLQVLKDISLGIGRGEFVALMGTSGSGKTTLMNILGCLDRPTSGQYYFDGSDVANLTPDKQAQLRNEKLGFVFQNFNLLPRTSALDNVIMPLTYSGDHLSDGDARRRATELLQRVGLGERLDHEPSQLSGGQQQRVAIARALVNRPQLLFADEPTGNLDSHTSEEVLEIFQRLNQDEGVTIVLVTHDEEVARCAKRVIRIHDGAIVAEDVPAQVAGMQSDDRRLDDQSGKTRWFSGAALLRARRVLRTALNGLRRNVMRAALTTLGIIIGVASVIAMMEIGRGSSNAIQQTIASMGANNLLILPGTASSGGVTFGAGSVMTLTPQDAEAIASESPAVRGVAPIVRARTQVVYGNRNWVPAFILGTTPSYLDVREWSIAAGDPFTNREVRNASKVCVVGQRLVKELFQGESPLGKELRVKNVPFKVIGVLSIKGANMMGMDQDDILLAPWTTIKYRVTGSTLANVNQSAATSSDSSTSGQVNSLNQIYPSTSVSLYPQQSATQAADTPLPVRFTNVDQIVAAGRSTAEVPAAIEQITQVLRERHRIRPGEPEDFNIRDMTEMTKALSSTATMMTKLLLAVALISLLVGGVGIMNIMLVSVTERTREIGLRMAVGAQGSAILQQFLAESVTLCFCGGAAGILVGRGISWLVRVLLKWPTELSLDAILAAFAVSATVGIVFGYYPAWKASRLDPIIALRYE